MFLIDVVLSSESFAWFFSRYHIASLTPAIVLDNVFFESSNCDFGLVFYLKFTFPPSPRVRFSALPQKTFASNSPSVRRRLVAGTPLVGTLARALSGLPLHSFGDPLGPAWPKVLAHAMNPIFFIQFNLFPRCFYF